MTLNIRRFYGPLTLEFAGPQPSFRLTFDRDDENGTLALGLLFGTLYISHERWWITRGPEVRYGFAFHSGSLWIHNGPDDFQHMKVLRFHGDWRYRNDLHTEIERGQHPYTYRWKFKPDTVQHVTAKVKEDHATWQWQIGRFKLPFFKRRHSIWCDFSEELGDQRKSWKGGTIGAGFPIQQGETWADAYRRMQTEAKFCRNK